MTNEELKLLIEKNTGCYLEPGKYREFIFEDQKFILYVIKPEPNFEPYRVYCKRTKEIFLLTSVRPHLSREMRALYKLITWDTEHD